MILYLLVGTLILGAAFLLMRAFLSASPGTLVRTLRYGGIAAGVLAVAFLAVTGRLGQALMLGSLAAPLLMRWRSLQRGGQRGGPSGQSAGGAGAGQSSEIETLYLRMRLDHDSGTLEGEVLHGPFRGRTLASLEEEERLSLLEDCRRNDPQSLSLLEGWLDRTHPDWRARADEARAGKDRSGSGPDSSGESGGGAKRPAGGSMTREEAYEILGISPGATSEEVKSAHRRLMMKVHPDHGGSTYLAAKINQAKDLLLRT
ncbi:DnaJ domain-containing protein [Azospirillum sp. SYSU D00513]|uniref:DnaJ domain-containing protein n=1 Tax=Azospirillum sp. SYSU D00513 TaxID=2812561 RepID=UPI001FFEA701|nr:DnaJ domain-containing protein [Azospirillum sp. SYSU D00513]